MDSDQDIRSIRFGFPERELLEFQFADAVSNQPRAKSEDWIDSNVTVRAGPFAGTAKVSVNSSDFARLLPELRKLYDTLLGEAVFTTIEQQVGFALVGDGKGHISLTGHVAAKAWSSNKLLFEIDFDQTLLSHSIADLERFLKLRF